MQWCGCRECHILCEKIFFLSGNLNNRVLATSPRDPEDHLVVFDMNYWMFGNYLAMVIGETGHAGYADIAVSLFSSEISGGYVEDVGA